MWQAIFLLASVYTWSSGNSYKHHAIKQILIIRDGLKKFSVDGRGDNQFYSCTGESILTWDVTDERNVIVFTYTFTSFDLVGLNYTQRVSTSSVVEAELTYRNSTHVSSTLKVSEVRTLFGYHVSCAGERKEITTVTNTSK